MKKPNFKAIATEIVAIVSRKQKKIVSRILVQKILVELYYSGTEDGINSLSQIVRENDSLGTSFRNS